MKNQKELYTYVVIQLDGDDIRTDILGTGAVLARDADHARQQLAVEFKADDQVEIQLRPFVAFR